MAVLRTQPCRTTRLSVTCTPMDQARTTSARAQPRRALPSHAGSLDGGVLGSTAAKTPVAVSTPAKTVQKLA